MNTSGKEGKYDSNLVTHLMSKRTYKGRRDSPQTLSKSCSDKLVLMSCKSLLNSLLSSVIDPGTCYLDYIIVPQAAFHEAAYYRAFSQRISAVSEIKLPRCFRVQPIRTLITNCRIPPSLTPAKANLQTSATAMTSIIHVPGRPAEVILGGIKMGHKFPADVRGASCLSRARIAKEFFEFICGGGGRWARFWDLSSECTYSELKRKVGQPMVSVKDSVKNVLGGWTANASEVDFTLLGPHHSSDGQ
jgi:tRNA-specific adenosine deaminase 1